MVDRKAILLRLPPDVLEAMQRWARDDLRSMNAQIEFVLREALRQRQRVKDIVPAKPPEAPIALPHPRAPWRKDPPPAKPKPDEASNDGSGGPA